MCRSWLRLTVNPPDRPLPERPWFCEDCNVRMTTEEADVQPIETCHGKRGTYYYVTSLKLLDEVESLPKTRCPVWHQDEKPRLKAMTEFQLDHEWNRRKRDIIELCERKAADPTVTVES